MNKSRLFLLSMLILFSTGLLPSTASAYDPGEYPVFYPLTKEDGLPDNSVKVIMKDSEGFMWFGTRHGLARYDGSSFKTYWAGDEAGTISGNRIHTLAEGSGKKIWVGTYANGLNLLEMKSDHFQHYGSSYGIGSRVNKVAVLDDGSVWVCSNEGLAKYLPELDSFQVYSADPSSPASLNSTSVYDIIKTQAGELYVSTTGRYIQRFDEENGVFTEVVYARDPGLNDNYNKKLAEGPDGTLYIIANEHGLSTYHPQSGESSYIGKGKGGLSSTFFFGDFLFDQEGKLWISTDGGGINVYNPESSDFTYIRHSEGSNESIASDNNYALYFDDENRLWVGSFDRGVGILDLARNKFSSSLFTHNDLRILDDKSVLALYQDSKQQLWAGTDGNGLYCFVPGGKLRIYKHDPVDPGAISSNVITSLGEDSKGNILAGTYLGGLNLIHANTNEIRRLHPSSSSIWEILTDSRERIWLGLLGEALDLYKEEEEQFENFGPASAKADRIRFTNVMEIMEDSDGDIWIGTEGNGIYILDKQSNRLRWLREDALGKLTSSSSINRIYEDYTGIYWIGTEGEGLIRYNKHNQDLKLFTRDDNLPGNVVLSMYEDRHLNLWIGTNQGLCRYNRSSGRMINFVREDGLSGLEFNRGALIQLEDGRLLAGTRTGADIISPDEISLNQNLPRVVISSLSILNREIEVGDTINGRSVLEKDIRYKELLDLKYGDKSFSLEFVALNYTLPEKCTYRYQLEGFDPEWIEVGAERNFANYTNLDPGKYVFKVMASNNDGKWGSNTTQLHIHVSAPFYRTSWFLTLVLLLVLVLMYAVYRIRLQIMQSNYLQKQNEQEKRIIELEKERLEKDLQALSLKRIYRNRILVHQKNKLAGISVKASEAVKESLEKVILEIDEELLEDRDWKYMEPQLDKVYNNFITKLNASHTDLTQTDVKLAAYVRMGLSTKEISEFMHKTLRGIESDRYRLRKKLGLDQQDSLRQYLKNI